MQNMRDLLRTTLGRSLETMPEADRLAAAWPVACGKAMADRGTIVGYERGIVSIEVNDPVWLAQMLSMRAMLERELARIAGVPVTAIHFEKRNKRG